MTYDQWAQERKSDEAKKAENRDPAAFWEGLDVRDLLEEVLK